MEVGRDKRSNPVLSIQGLQGELYETVDSVDQALQREMFIQCKRKKGLK